MALFRAIPVLHSMSCRKSIVTLRFLATAKYVWVIPNHICPLINLHDQVYVISGEQVVEK